MSNIIECREIKPERSWLLKIETSLLAGKYRVISSSSKNFPDPSLSLTISGSQSLSTMPLPGNFLRFSEQRARNNFLGTVARADRSIVRDFSANSSSILSRAREKGIKKLFTRSPDEIAPLYRHSPLNSTVTSQFCNELQLPRKWEHWLHCFLLVSYPFVRYSCNIFVSFC